MGEGAGVLVGDGVAPGCEGSAGVTCPGSGVGGNGWKGVGVAVASDGASTYVAFKVPWSDAAETGIPASIGAPQPDRKTANKAKRMIC